MDVQSDPFAVVSKALAEGPHPVILAFPGSGTTFARLALRDVVQSDLHQENWSDIIPYYGGAPRVPKASITFRTEEFHKRGLGPFIHLVRHPMRVWASVVALAKRRQADPHGFCEYLRTEIEFPRCEGDPAQCLLRAQASFQQLVTGLNLPTIRIEDFPRDPDQPDVNPHVVGKRKDRRKLWEEAFAADTAAAAWLEMFTFRVYPPIA